jgi:hypothetical protein
MPTITPNPKKALFLAKKQLSGIFYRQLQCSFSVQVEYLLIPKYTQM